MQLPEWLNFSFVAGMASILGVFLTLFAGAKFAQRLRQRTTAKGRTAGTVMSTSASNTTGNVTSVGGNVNVTVFLADFERYVAGAAKGWTAG